MKYFPAIIFFFCFAACDTAAQGTKQIVTTMADSLFAKGQWQKSRDAYQVLVHANPEKINALTWNRLGFCYHNLQQYNEALTNYHRAMASRPTSQLKPYITSRMARAYAMVGDLDKAFVWLDSATKAGYSNLKELDTCADFRALRMDLRFQSAYQSAYAINYPCSANPHNREFDFWIGEWDVVQTGTTSPVVGQSVIQNASGGCMVLENWTSLANPYEGKSINFFDPSANSWQQVWMGSGADLQRFFGGEYKDAAMRFTFEATKVNGQIPIGRLTFFNHGKNQVRQLSEQSLDQGKTWTTNYDLTYLRKQ